MGKILFILRKELKKLKESEKQIVQKKEVIEKQKLYDEYIREECIKKYNFLSDCEKKKIDETIYQKLKKVLFIKL